MVLQVQSQQAPVQAELIRLLIPQQVPAGAAHLPLQHRLLLALHLTAVAGTAVQTCANSGAVNITAGSSAANYSTIAWSGAGTFTNANSLTTATYTPTAAEISAGTATITLTANPNAPCATVAVSTKILTINAGTGKLFDYTGKRNYLPGSCSAINSNKFNHFVRNCHRSFGKYKS